MSRTKSYNNKNTLPISNEVPCVFNGIFYRSGASKSGNYTLIEIRLSDDKGRELKDTTWNVNELTRTELQFFLLKFSQLGKALSGEDIWGNYEYNPLSKKNYTKAYQNVIKSFNRFKGNELYAKTIVKGCDQGSCESMLPDRELLFLDDNIIFSREEGVLEYNDLERNNLESFGMDPDNIEEDFNF